MKIFIISDTHFHHENIIKYSNRIFKSVEEMDKEIIRRWNDKVGKEDIVLHLGDCALGSEKEVKELKDSLNGNIFLLKGNHDHKMLRKAEFIIIKGLLRQVTLFFTINDFVNFLTPSNFLLTNLYRNNLKSYRFFNINLALQNSLFKRHCKSFSQIHSVLNGKSLKFPKCFSIDISHSNKCFLHVLNMFINLPLLDSSV